MFKKALIVCIVLQLPMFTQSDVKKHIKDMLPHILNIESYKANLHMRLNIQGLQEYFENISIDLTYVNRKKKIHIEGVPLLPNNAILTKQIKNSIKKVWDYLLFPYIFDILFKEQFLSSASISESGDNSKTVTISNLDKKFRNISKIQYILDKDLLPGETQVFYTNGAIKLIKVGFEKVNDKEYIINTVREEFKTRGGNNRYINTAEITYGEINNFMLPTQISYNIKFGKIPNDEFKTVININYIAVKTNEEFNSKQKKARSDTTQDADAFGTKKDTNLSGKSESSTDTNSGKAECVPPPK